MVSSVNCWGVKLARINEGSWIKKYFITEISKQQAYFLLQLYSWTVINSTVITWFKITILTNHSNQACENFILRHYEHYHKFRKKKSGTNVEIARTFGIICFNLMTGIDIASTTSKNGRRCAQKFLFYYDNSNYYTNIILDIIPCVWNILHKWCFEIWLYYGLRVTVVILLVLWKLIIAAVSQAV